jgi:hypothetical protein
MPPKLVAMSYLMEEHSPKVNEWLFSRTCGHELPNGGTLAKGKWMIVLECVVHVTTIIVAPKKIIIMGQKIEHLYMF